jgi:hypothetical protein
LVAALETEKELITEQPQCSSLVETTKEKIIGRNPDLADLDQGDLKHDIDFRSVYASILKINWTLILLNWHTKPYFERTF